MTAADLALIGIDPESILYAFSFGFMAVYGMYFVGYGARLALELIRKL